MDFNCANSSADGVPEVGVGWVGKGRRPGAIPGIPTDGIVGIGITVSTPDPARMMDFYIGAMEFERVAPQVARCGDTLLFVEKGPGGSETDDFTGSGYRYLTVQIFDADKECQGIIARGGRLARAPADYGKIARVAFVKDPDGNWIEISARASLTGVAVGTEKK